MQFLTNKLRTLILDAALTARFTADHSAVQSALVQLGDAVYENAFGAVRSQANAMPEGWMGYDDTITITCDGFSKRDYNRPDEELSSTLKMSQKQPVPVHFVVALHDTRRPRVDVDDDSMDDDLTINQGHPLYSAAQDILQQHRRVITAEAEARTAVHSILYSCRTVEKLMETWPEVEPFLPPMIEPTRNLPVEADLTAKVNQMLRLAA